VIADFEDGQVAHERVCWDQASLLVLVKALDSLDRRVTGNEQAADVLEQQGQGNELVAGVANRRESA
jgi:hypothetical protein